MSSILFGQSYYLRFDPKLFAAMQPYPPLGTLYAASYARARGHDVAVFDAMLAESETEWEDALALHQPRVAVLFEDNFNYLSKMCLLRMRAAAFAMLHAAKARGCIAVVSGADATDNLAKYFDHGADYILIGEGEITLGELLGELETIENHKSKIENVKGLAFRNPGGSITRTPPREYLRELDILPFPAWDLIDIEKYRRAWKSRHGYFSLNLATTRGCPYHCNWCAKPVYGQRYNSRSPENVVAEIQMLKANYAPDHLEFADDILGLKPNWLERFADLVEEKSVRVPFKCLARADLLTDSFVRALQRAGCATVWMGAESGSQKILDAMDKGQRVEQIVAAAARLHRAGIRVGFFLQFGYLGEARADIEQTLQMIRDCAPDDIGISVSYPLPGTKFYERVQAQLGAKQNWNDSNDLAMLYRGAFSPDFYRVLHRRVHAEFRFRRAWRELARVAAHPARWRAQHAQLALTFPLNFARWQFARFQLRILELPGNPQTATAVGLAR
ncbi:MAG: B12-binding domain-containing radical SAM protein [Chloroflexi bacterium]|nr:B12-binding domain-containing radical SAM protein [Chloroflexota bacterium]